MRLGQDAQIAALAVCCGMFIWAVQTLLGLHLTFLSMAPLYWLAVYNIVKRIKGAWNTKALWIGSMLGITVGVILINLF